MHFNMTSKEAKQLPTEQPVYIQGLQHAQSTVVKMLLDVPASHSRVLGMD